MGTFPSKAVLVMLVRAIVVRPRRVVRPCDDRDTTNVSTIAGRVEAVAQVGFMPNACGKSRSTARSLVAGISDGLTGHIAECLFVAEQDQLPKSRKHPIVKPVIITGVDTKWR